MTDKERVVTGGVDTHNATHVAAVIDGVGRILDTAVFPATAAGCRRMLGWMRGLGRVVRVGVEGTGSYGAGLARHVRCEDIEVVEVNRPNRQARRRRGKSDTVDAEAAARAALNGEAAGAPKSGAGVVESIRALRVAFTSMRATRTRIANQIQIRDLVLTPLSCCGAASGPSTPTAGCIVASVSGPPTCRTRLRRPSRSSGPGRQHQALTFELDALRAELDTGQVLAQLRRCLLRQLRHDASER